MSVENNKVCCNCRHNIRTGEIDNIQCHCDIDGSYIGYVQCLEHWCKHWSKETENEQIADRLDDPPIEFIEDSEKLTKEQFDSLFDSGWRT